MNKIVRAAEEVLEAWDAVPEDYDLPEEPKFLFDLFLSIAHLDNVYSGYPESEG